MTVAHLTLVTSSIRFAGGRIEVELARRRQAFGLLHVGLGACHAPNGSYDCNRSSRQKVLNLGALNRRRLRDVRERIMSDDFDSLDASEKAAKRPSDDVVQPAPVRCRYTKSGICANI